jgi:hypothetical protein
MNMDLLHRSRIAMAAAVAASTLVACGGGGGGDGLGGVALGGPASDCFNPAQYTPGTSSQLQYSISGAFTGTATINGSVGQPTAFNGTANLIPVTQTLATSYSVPSSAGSSTISVTTYQQLDGTDVLTYGAVGTVTVLGLAAVNTSTVYSPPSRDKRYSLTTGGTYTRTDSTTSTVTPPGTTQSATTSTVVTYLGQETVTVPAGTFTACKFIEAGPNPSPLTWIAKGKGVMVRSEAPTGTGNVIMQLQPGSLLNGAPV